jgi:hypothetical protein
MADSSLLPVIVGGLRVMADADMLSGLAALDKPSAAAFADTNTKGGR